MRGLEYVGITLAGALLGEGLVVDAARIVDFTVEQRNSKFAVESELVEIVLDNRYIDVVERELKSAYCAFLAGAIVDGVHDAAVGSEARFVDKCVGQSHLHAFRPVAELNRRWELHREFLHIQAFPLAKHCLVQAALGIVVTFGEFSHVLMILARSKVHNHILGSEYITRQIYVLKWVHRRRGDEVFPELNLSGDVKFRIFFGALAVVVHLLQVVGHRHIDVEVEPFKFVVAPRHEAAVVWLHHVFRRLKLALEARFWFLNLEILQERHRAAFWNKALRADTHARRAEHEYLILGSLGFGHYKCAEEVHSGIGRRKFHLRDGEVDRSRVDGFRNLKREGHIFHISAKQSEHLSLAIDVILIILRYVETFCQAFSLSVGHRLQFVGVWQTCVAYDVVDAPVGEQFVNHFGALHLVFGASPSFYITFVHLVVGIHRYVVKLHGELPSELERFPYYVAIALKVTRLVVDCFQFAVEHKLVFAYTDALALEVIYGARCGGLIGDIHLVGALEVAVGEELRHAEVDHIERVANKHHCGVVNRLWLNAKHHIVALIHQRLNLVPTDGVGNRFYVLNRVDRLFLEHFLARDVFLVAIKLDVVGKLYGVGLDASAAQIFRLTPFYLDIVAQKFLAGALVGVIARRYDFGCCEVIHRIVVNHISVR